MSDCTCVERSMQIGPSMFVATTTLVDRKCPEHGVEVWLEKANALLPTVTDEGQADVLRRTIAQVTRMRDEEAGDE